MATPFWYNTALHLLKPFYHWRIKKRAESQELYNQECLERFGPFESPKNVRAIWFHAVSVGETNAAQPLIEHYLKLGQPVLVTNTTKTGQARAKSLFLKAPYLDLFQAVYLPVDQKHLLKQFFELYQPKLLALVETELWPNLIDQAKLQQVPCLLLNARLSEKSAKGYSRVSGLTAGMLKQIDWVLAQDNATRQRYVELGLDQQKSQVVGNIKFDIHAPEAFINQAAKLYQLWYLGQRKVLTIASTHAPEELQILQALQPYLRSDPELVCIVVPRHPERFDEVFEICQNLDLITHRRSLNQSIHTSTQVYLADSMGELWLWYALSQVCFVGGSLNEPGGGHNILEPMVLNVPTVIGPRYFNFQTIVDEFIDENGVLIAQDAEQVVAIWMACLAEPEEAKQVVEQAHKVLQRNQGSLQKHIGVINRYLAEKP
ncbi:MULTISPECIES: 3-deoxy-D-manno-octulosonic acid transferase [Acinetobacter calcoaceticus/baumannii complex]|uniref:3-deoxy-D-manno-octulosonic acid transferase n=1 Tax=Acinetobacter calcoaceticus/baumannii complex TaxID=909768 RepID=UPI00044EDBEE|nr:MULTISPECIES: 3-deoxy-D-manno-octulosonic acid transferase [Acinetobacter calcoaceticus/baumannii complex]EXR43040.1 glycosyl transferases group 1 family protein [Acinetobacter sp. 1294243]KCX15866.1 glycosyl transferases group 1 family protein [Acinetobacter sp. 1264765]KQG48726.1 3-deoxy-D-manno-2-octulosonate transferase [Acinetobacter pittii]MBN6513900.1 3-deoxy-D-manno-octulosonic acid transferase [Acinetobacter pittii]MCK0868105.1 3-deoxy-D-manno-octulosonic acid transferase [Acinetob